METNIKILETERLRLLPLCEEHAPQIQEKFPKWEIVKFLSDKIPWPYPENGAHDFIKHVAIPNMAEGVEWHWAIFPKSQPQELIGVMTLRESDVENRGFWLAKEWQNRGLMTEAVNVVTDFWFFDLNKEKLTIPKAVRNYASSAISKKQGMRLVGHQLRKYVIGTETAEIWEITRDEWKIHSAFYDY